MPKIRIQKALAEAGLASRRAVEEIVLEGRVTVNGEMVNTLPCFVDLAEDEVHVDGRRIRAAGGDRKVYFLLNKPRGVVCTQNDPEGRPRAVDLVPPVRERVYCAGRLDAESTGVIILTNDGDLTEHLTHPRFGVPKTYIVEIDGMPSPESMERLKGGVYMDGRRTNRARLKLLGRSPKRSVMEITLTEGRNREIRRLLAKVGHKVRRLKRVAIGPVTDRGLKIGAARDLTKTEIARLRKAGRRDRKVPKGE